jgi:OFA family oxalate/formate antiporter-like MFS transporter
MVIFVCDVTFDIKMSTAKTDDDYIVKEVPATRKAASRYRIFINVLASILIMCCAGSVYAWSIFVAPLKTTYGMSTAQTQLIFGFIIASFSVTMLFAGRIERRRGPRLTASIGAFLFCFGYLLASFSDGNLVLLVTGIGILSGAGMGFGYVTVLSNLVRWFPRHKGLATGIAVAGFGSGAIILSQIAQPVLDRGTIVVDVFRYISIIYGVIFLVSALGISKPIDNGKGNWEKPIPITSLFKDQRFWILFYTYFAGSFAALMLIGNLKPIGLSYGITDRVAGLAIVLLSVGNASGRIMWGQIYDKVGGKRSVAVALALAALFTLVLLTEPSNSLLFLLLSLVLGLCLGANFVLYASDVSHIYGISQLGIVYPAVSLAYGIAGITGPIVGGVLSDITNQYFIPIILCAAICLSGMLVYVLFMGRVSFNSPPR